MSKAKAPRRLKTCRALDIEEDEEGVYIYYRTSHGGVQTDEPICIFDSEVGPFVLQLLEELGHDLRFFEADGEGE